MRAGDLKHEIILQYPKRTPDTWSGREITWIDSATVWAAVWPIRSSPVVDNQKREIEATHRFRIWFRTKINQEYRISFRGREYTIISIINPNESNIYLDIMASDRV